MADETSLFEGAGGAKGCTEFIRSVRAYAFAQGMIRDDEWMADYASTRIAGDAGIWYENLERETRASWELLRKALVDQYTVASITPILSPTIPTPTAAAPVINRAQESSTDSSPPLVPTPTAAASGPSYVPSSSLGSISVLRSVADVMATGTEPPKSNLASSPSNVVVSPKSHSTTTVGFLRCLIAPYTPTNFYISNKVGLDPAKRALLRTTMDREDAMRVSYVTSAAESSRSYKHIAVEGTEYRLGIVWSDGNPSFEWGSESHSGLTAAKLGGESISHQDQVYPSKKWTGQLHAEVWHIARGGEVTAALRKDNGILHSLGIGFIPVPSMFSPCLFEVYFCAEYHGFQRTRPAWEDCQGRLMFEPI